MSLVHQTNSGEYSSFVWMVASQWIISDFCLLFLHQPILIPIFCCLQPLLLRSLAIPIIHLFQNKCPISLRERERYRLNVEPKGRRNKNEAQSPAEDWIKMDYEGSSPVGRVFRNANSSWVANMDNRLISFVNIDRNLVDGLSPQIKFWDMN